MKYFFFGSPSRYNIYKLELHLNMCKIFLPSFLLDQYVTEYIIFLSSQFQFIRNLSRFFWEISTHYDDINAHISRKYGCLQSICMRLWLQPTIKYSFFYLVFFRFCSRTHKIRSKPKYTENYKSGKFHTATWHFDSFTLACALVFPLVTHRDICVKKFSMLSIFVGFSRERSTFVQTSLIHADTTNGINMRR